MTDTWERSLTHSGDGTITGHQGFWGQARSDGSVTFPDGTVRGRLLADGRVVDAADVTLATIADDGSATVNRCRLHFDSEGNLVGGDTSKSIRLTPPDTPAIRTAMLIFLLTQFRPRQAKG